MGGRGCLCARRRGIRRTVVREFRNAPHPGRCSTMYRGFSSIALLAVFLPRETQVFLASRHLGHGIPRASATPRRITICNFPLPAWSPVLGGRFLVVSISAACRSQICPRDPYPAICSTTVFLFFW